MTNTSECAESGEVKRGDAKKALCYNLAVDLCVFVGVIVTILATIP